MNAASHIQTDSSYRRSKSNSQAISKESNKHFREDYCHHCGVRQGKRSKGQDYNFKYSSDTGSNIQNGEQSNHSKKEESKEEPKSSNGLSSSYKRSFTVKKEVLKK